MTWTEDCDVCLGAGVTTAHLLSLRDHAYLGEWTVASSCGCRPNVYGVPRSADALVDLVKRTRGIDAVSFPTHEMLRTWMKANPGSKGRTVYRAHDYEHAGQG